MDPDLFPLDAQEARVLGCLIEKAMTTPDQYPMSLNSVRVACNQVSNRNPIVDFDETAVATTLRRLADRGLAKFVHRAGDRVVKYIHAADDVLEATDKQLALLAVLLLRGPQTPGELRQRTTRYVEFTGLPELETTLEELRRHEASLAVELPRMPGQKETRWRNTITEATEDDVADPTPVSEAPAPATDHGEEVDELRRELDELRLRFEQLLNALGVEDI